MCEVCLLLTIKTPEQRNFELVNVCWELFWFCILAQNSRNTVIFSVHIKVLASNHIVLTFIQHREWMAHQRRSKSIYFEDLGGRKVILALFVFSIDAHYSLKFISEKLWHSHFLDIFPKTLGQLIFLAHVKYYFQLLWNFASLQRHMLVGSELFLKKL